MTSVASSCSCCVVFIRQQAIRFAAAANVDADGRVTMTGEVWMRQRIAFESSSLLAVGQVFKDGRDGMLVGILWQPDARGQICAVAQGDQGVLNLAYLVRKSCNDQAVHPFTWTLQEGVGQNKIVVAYTGQLRRAMMANVPGAATDPAPSVGAML